MTTRTVSMQEQIAAIDGLRDTCDLTEWEQGFVTSIVERFLLNGKRTDWMSDKQTEIVERIWSKHFA